MKARTLAAIGAFLLIAAIGSGLSGGIAAAIPGQQPIGIIVLWAVPLGIVAAVVGWLVAMRIADA